MAKEKKQFEGKGIGVTRSRKIKSYDNPYEYIGEGNGVGYVVGKIKSFGSIRSAKLG